ncbi:MAG: c-type cytochrome [Desulfuromonadales bacterium]
MSDRKMLMKMMLTVALCLLVYIIFESPTRAVEQENGEDGFKEHCAECHREGGNIVNPNKTLSEKDRKSNGIKTVDEIVRIMRKPGEGMTRFDEKTISDKDARRIAVYIINTFK